MYSRVCLLGCLMPVMFPAIMFSNSWILVFVETCVGAVVFAVMPSLNIDCFTSFLVIIFFMVLIPKFV
ncbi:hypothetical protein BDR26DRAFT_873573 [Obelidium mucronatum]|nr:hypothetical protein BDR26DRAFT_873573 [Obelidium mucronatum]